MKLLASLRKQCARPALSAALGVAPLAVSPIDLDAPGTQLLKPNAAASTPSTATPSTSAGIPDTGLWQVLWSRGVPLTPTWTATVDVDDGLQLCLRLKLH